LALQTPTTKQISDTLVAQIEAGLSQSAPLFPKAFIRVLAWALAGVVVLIYKYGSYTFLQMFVAHAAMEETTIGNKKFSPLVAWGRLVGVGDPSPATRAELTIAVPVMTQTGSLKAGAQVVSSATGIVYTSIVDTPLNAAFVNVRVRASSSTQDPDSQGEGAIGNLSPGDVVSFVSPYPNVGTTCAVVSQEVQGADAQGTEDYRRQIMLRFRRRPQGGAHADYDAWAREVDGISNAYPYAGDVAGTVKVYVEATPASSGNPDGIPTSAQLAAVKDAVRYDAAQGATRAPVLRDGAINVLPITRRMFDVTVAGLNPDTPEVRDAIADGVDEYLRAREPYIVGLSTPPRADSITQAGVSGVIDSIASANDGAAGSVVLSSGAVYLLLPGEKAKLGSVAFVP
jgi:uncharacterized phage protein gp47/JayE